MWHFKAFQPSRILLFTVAYFLFSQLHAQPVEPIAKEKIEAAFTRKSLTTSGRIDFLRQSITDSKLHEHYNGIINSSPRLSRIAEQGRAFRQWYAEQLNADFSDDPQTREWMFGPAQTALKNLNNLNLSAEATNERPLTELEIQTRALSETMQRFSLSAEQIFSGHYFLAHHFYLDQINRLNLKTQPKPKTSDGMAEEILEKWRTEMLRQIDEARAQNFRMLLKLVLENRERFMGLIIQQKDGEMLDLALTDFAFLRIEPVQEVSESKSYIRRKSKDLKAFSVIVPTFLTSPAIAAAIVTNYLLVSTIDNNYKSHYPSISVANTPNLPQRFAFHFYGPKLREIFNGIHFDEAYPHLVKALDSSSSERRPLFLNKKKAWLKLYALEAYEREKSLRQIRNLLALPVTSHQALKTNLESWAEVESKWSEDDDQISYTKLAHQQMLQSDANDPLLDLVWVPYLGSTLNPWSEFDTLASQHDLPPINEETKTGTKARRIYKLNLPFIGSSLVAGSLLVLFNFNLFPLANLFRFSNQHLTSPSSVAPIRNSEATNVSEKALGKAKNSLLYTIEPTGSLQPEELPRLFDVASESDIQTMAEGKYRVLEFNELHGSDFTITSQAPSTPDEKGFFTIPLPRFSTLVAMELTHETDPQLDINYTVVRPVTAPYYLVVKLENFSPTDRFHFRATYQIKTNKPDPATRDWEVLNPLRVKDIANKVRAAGIRLIADALDDAASKATLRDPLTVKQVSEIIAKKSQYSYDAVTDLEIDSNNPFATFSKFLKDGCLNFQCTGADQFTQIFFREYFKEDPEVTVRSITTLPRDPENLYLTAAAHVQTLVMYDQKIGRIIDSTPSLPKEEESRPSAPTKQSFIFPNDETQIVDENDENQKVKILGPEDQEKRTAKLLQAKSELLKAMSKASIPRSVLKDESTPLSKLLDLMSLVKDYSSGEISLSAAEVRVKKLSAAIAHREGFTAKHLQQAVEVAANEIASLLDEIQNDKNKILFKKYSSLKNPLIKFAADDVLRLLSRTDWSPAIPSGAAKSACLRIPQLVAP